MKTLLITILLAMLLGCGDGGNIGGTGSFPVDQIVRDVWDSSSGSVPIARDVQQPTPKGARVYSRKGVPAAILADTDEALTKLFADARTEYGDEVDPLSVNYAAYEIYEYKYDCVNVSGTLSFYVKDSGLSYDGSQWDYYNSQGVGVKDGKSVITAAEQIFSYTSEGSTPRRAMMMVCLDPNAYKNAVRYGGEHNILVSGSDRMREWYYLTETHTVFYHPLIFRGGR